MEKTKRLKHPHGSSLRMEDLMGHLRVHVFGLLGQEFIASLLPKGKQPEVAGEENLCADLESERTTELSCYRQSHFCKEVRVNRLEG